MSSLPKWTEERTAQLTTFIGDESPVSQASVAAAAEDLETSTRSVSSKLRKMGFDVDLASAGASRAFSEAQEDTLSAFVQTTVANILMLKLLVTLKTALSHLSLFKARFCLWN